MPDGSAGPNSSAFVDMVGWETTDRYLPPVRAVLHFSHLLAPETLSNLQDGHFSESTSSINENRPMMRQISA